VNVARAKHTALLVMDLQVAMGGIKAAPRSVQEVVATAVQLVDAARSAGVQVFFTRAGTEPDGRDWPATGTDRGQPARIPKDAMKPLDGLSVEPGDVVITKRQWGAFYGTDLELQLRRRGISTLILVGVATNFVVEGTAREAWQLGFEQFFVEQGMTSFSTEMHEFSVTQILPMLGHVVDVAGALAVLGHPGPPDAAGSSLGS
jgi:nicotinamidase-related amidase